MEIDNAQGGLIKDIIAKIKKEQWTGRGAFHLSQTILWKERSKARYSRSSVSDDILALERYPKTGVE